MITGKRLSPTKAKRVARAIRKLQGDGMTDREIGEKIGRTGMTVARLARGVHGASPATAAAVACVLGVTVAALLDGSAS